LVCAHKGLDFRKRTDEFVGQPLSRGSRRSSAPPSRSGRPLAAEGCTSGRPALVPKNLPGKVHDTGNHERRTLIGSFDWEGTESQCAYYALMLKGSELSKGIGGCPTSGSRHACGPPQTPRALANRQSSENMIANHVACDGPVPSWPSGRVVARRAAGAPRGRFPNQQQKFLGLAKLVRYRSTFFFGGVSRRGLPGVIEKAISQWGLPNGYVLGEEAGGRPSSAASATARGMPLHQERRRPEGCVLAGPIGRMGFRRRRRPHHDASLQPTRDCGDLSAIWPASVGRPILSVASG